MDCSGLLIESVNFDGELANIIFTPDNEDLVLVSADGTLYLMDPLTGENREDPVNLGAEFA